MQRRKAVLKAVVCASLGPFIAVPCRTRRKFLPFVIPSILAPFAVDRGKVLHDVNDLLFFGPLPSCRLQEAEIVFGVVTDDRLSAAQDIPDRRHFRLNARRVGDHCRGNMVDFFRF